MSIALQNQVNDMERRLAALERAAARWVAPLQARNAKRKADGALLREAIRSIMALSDRDLSAGQVLRSISLRLSDIGRTKRPSLRTVQWHMKKLRNASALRVSAPA